MDSYTNLIVCCISITWLVVEKIYYNTTDIVCYLISWYICDVVCACRVIFMHMKEGAGRSRWQGKDNVVVLYVCVLWRKGPAGAGRCEDGVWYCVLL